MQNMVLIPIPELLLANRASIADLEAGMGDKPWTFPPYPMQDSDVLEPFAPSQPKSTSPSAVPTLVLSHRGPRSCNIIVSGLCIKHTDLICMRDFDIRFNHGDGAPEQSICPGLLTCTVEARTATPAEESIEY
jgi:hypothetical protein